MNLTDKSESQALTLEAIIAPNAEIEKIAGGFEFTEEPVWHPEGFLLFSDIRANTISMFASWLLFGSCSTLIGELFMLISPM